MAQHHQYLDLPVDIPKRKTRWFVWVLAAFALLVMGGMLYAFLGMVSAPMPKVEIPEPAQPSEWPTPASRPR